MDETELSFIRCQNCRSLVPAVASRCRMCGFILKDASSKQTPPTPDNSRAEAVGNAAPNLNEEPLEDRPSRVRQRTISVSGNSNFTSSVAEAPPEPPPIIKPVAPPEPVASPPTPQITQPVEQSIPEEMDESFEEDFEEEDEELENSPGSPFNSETSAAPESELVKKKRRRRRRKKRPAGGGMDQGSIPQSPPPAPAPIAAAPEPRREPVLRPMAASAPAEEGIAPWRTPPSNAEGRPGFKIEQKIERAPEQAAPLPIEAKENVETQRRQEPRQQENGHQMPRQVAVAGSLVGWLVSFAEDKKGVSHELRDGRFFVGREQLRPSDFVIDHSTVSTPQCLVVCDPVSGVTVQDLMSERGTTLIRGSSALEKSSEQVRLENGDRIRFGEYEMLFVKLPQGR